MANYYHYDGIDNTVLTFPTEEVEATPGKVCKLVGGSDLMPFAAFCADGEAFCGVFAYVADYMSSVAVRGVVEVPFTCDAGATPEIGWAKLSANGRGGVKPDATNGREYLVLQVDTRSSSDQTAGVLTLVL